MTRKSKAAAVFVFWFLTLFSVCSEVIAETTPEEIIEVGKNGLQAFLERVPPNELAKYGFGPEYPIAQANVGVPFKVFTITPSSLFGYIAGDTVSSIISPTGMWYFPVMVNDRIRAILTVAELKGVWQAVAFGQAGLAEELEEVTRKWPRSKGYDPFLIMVFQAKAYFFTVPQKNDYNLTPFVFEGKGFGSSPSEGERKYESLPELSGVITELQNAVKENIRGAP